MKLIVQTSSASFGLGLMSDAGVLHHEIHGTDRSARSRDLGALFRDLTRSAGCALSEIDAVWVDLGPGGLSSTRAGVSFANALAFAAPARLWGVSALELLMLHARELTQRPVCSMRPAQGGLAFWALYEGRRMVASGCERPELVLPRITADHGAVALAGPLPRLRLAPETLNGVEPLEIDPPALRHFAQATRRVPVRVGATEILEPITGPEALAAG